MPEQSDYAFLVLLFAIFTFFIVVAIVIVNQPKLIEFIKNDKGKIIITIRQKRNGMFLVHDSMNGHVIRFTRYVDIEAYVSRRVNGWKL